MAQINAEHEILWLQEILSALEDELQFVHGKLPQFHENRLDALLEALVTN